MEKRIRPRFFRKAFTQPHTVNPSTITVARMPPSEGGRGDEDGFRVLAPIGATASEIPEQRVEQNRRRLND
jgi:hypothetical protein